MPMLTIHNVTSYRYRHSVFLREHGIMMRLQDRFDQHPRSALVTGLRRLLQHHANNGRPVGASGKYASC